jgi:hypothetical protein
MPGNSTNQIQFVLVLPTVFKYDLISAQLKDTVMGVVTTDSITCFRESQFVIINC